MVPHYCTYCAPSLSRMVIRDTNCGNIDGGALLERNVIAQSINTGHDVANIQFDLQGGCVAVHIGCLQNTK